MSRVIISQLIALIRLAPCWSLICNGPTEGLPLNGRHFFSRLLSGVFMELGVGILQGRK